MDVNIRQVMTAHDSKDLQKLCLSTLAFGAGGLGLPRSEYTLHLLQSDISFQFVHPLAKNTQKLFRCQLHVGIFDNDF